MNSLKLRSNYARKLKHSLPQSSGFKWLISLFILWHLFALTIWLLPYSPGLVENSLRVVRPYMTVTGFRQSWEMFAPLPDRLDAHVQARITYAGGQVRLWDFPRMQNMGYARRYQRERFHKLIENAHRDQYSYLWPYLARYAARCNNILPGHPPVSVELIRYYRIIPPPGLPAPSDYTATEFYRTSIEARDLK